MTWTISLCCKSQNKKEQAAVEDSPLEQVVPEGWISLFDGKTLAGWEIVRYGGEGEPYVKNGSLVLPRAVNGLMTGVCWVGDSLPNSDYIIYYEAKRVEGYDIFAGLSFPCGDSYASLIIGGWGGIVNGLSCINGYDASENETTQHFSVRDNEWLPIELYVTTERIRAVLKNDVLFDVSTKGKNIHLRGGLLDTGFTLWTYLTTGEIKNLRIKKLKNQDEKTVLNKSPNSK